VEVSFAEAARTWARVALQSFGGPTGQIAVMHRILVEEKRWISEERFFHALSSGDLSGVYDEIDQLERAPRSAPPRLVRLVLGEDHASLSSRHSP